MRRKCSFFKGEKKITWSGDFAQFQHVVSREEFVHRFAKNHLFFRVIQIGIDGNGAFTSCVTDLHHTELSSETHFGTNFVAQARGKRSNPVGENVTIAFDIIDDFRSFDGDLSGHSLVRSPSRWRSSSYPNGRR